MDKNRDNLNRNKQGSIKQRSGEKDRDLNRDQNFKKPGQSSDFNKYPQKDKDDRDQR